MTTTLLTRTTDLVEDATRREFIALLGAAGLLTACGSGDQAPLPSGQTRTVTHTLGSAQVPVSPTRVAAVSIIASDPLLTLGVPAVAVPDFVPGVLEPLAAKIGLRIGVGDELNLEALAAAAPDLILAESSGGELYGPDLATLETIAPTVVYDFTTDYAWRDYYLFFADVLGRAPEAKARLTALDDRIAQTATAVGDPSGITVSVVEYTPGTGLRYFRTGKSFAGNVLDAVGFARPDVPADTNEVSLENLDAVDADALFVFSGSDDDADSAGFSDEPLAPTLRARVFPVGGHWFGFGLLAAEAILDDVERLLAAAPS